MSVVWSKQTGIRELGDSDKPDVQAQVEYLVYCSTSSDDPDVALATVPPLYSVYVGTVGAAVGSYYFALNGLVVKNRHCKVKDFTGGDGGGILYEIMLDYGTDTIDPKQKDPNPLKRDRIVKLSMDSTEEEIYQNPAGTAPKLIKADGTIPISFAFNNQAPFFWRWGNTVCNSAHQNFEPSVKEIFRDPVLTIQMNVPFLPWDTVLQYSNTINNDQFDIEYRGQTFTVGKGKGWLYEINSEPRYENGIAYEEVSVVLKIRNDGWLRKILDQGLEQLNNGDTPSRPIRDKNGDPVRQPALLDGMGGDLRLVGAHDPPRFLVWQFKKDKAFGGLPFWKD